MRRSRADGDEDFTVFATQASDRLYRSAYLLTTSHAAAEDLLQTTLVKAFSGWRRVRATDDPVAYAHRILLNTFLSERRLRRSGELALADLPETSPADAVSGPGLSEEVAERLALAGALRQLSALDRAVVVLRFWHDHSVAVTAAELDLTEAAVKNRTSRALSRLRDLLADDHPIPRSTR